MPGQNLVLQKFIKGMKNLVFLTLRSFTQAGNSFQHFSSSYTLKDEYYHCLTSDAIKIASYNAQSLVNKLRSSFGHNRLP